MPIGICAKQLRFGALHAGRPGSNDDGLDDGAVWPLLMVDMPGLASLLNQHTRQGYSLLC